jgi:serine/threonine protein kinase
MPESEKLVPESLPEITESSQGIAGYLVVSVLGCSHSSVFAAVSTPKSQHVAIKRLDKLLIATCCWVRSRLGVVPKEVAILTRLSHPGIIKLIEIVEDDNFIYIVMERSHHTNYIPNTISHSSSDESLKSNNDHVSIHNFLASESTCISSNALETSHSTPFNENLGLETPPPSNVVESPIHQLKINCKSINNSASLDLYAWLRYNSSPSQPVLKYIFRQITIAVDYMHNSGICHLDIKDENIIINPYTLETKIIDFGSSDYIPLNRKDFFGKFRGTPAYAPPEIMRGETFDGPKVDVWALGILLHVLSFSTTPFRSEDDVMQGRLCTEGSNHGSMDLIRFLLNSEPNIRPTAGDVLKHGWLN